MSPRRGQISPKIAAIVGFGKEKPGMTPRQIAEEISKAHGPTSLASVRRALNRHGIRKADWGKKKEKAVELLRTRPDLNFSKIAREVGAKATSWIGDLNRQLKIRPEQEVERLRTKGRKHSWKRDFVVEELRTGEKPYVIAKALQKAAEARGERFDYRTYKNFVARIFLQAKINKEKRDRFFLGELQKKGVVPPEWLISYAGIERTVGFLRQWQRQELPWETLVRYNCWRFARARPKSVYIALGAFKRFLKSIAGHDANERKQLIEARIVAFEKASQLRRKPV